MNGKIEPIGPSARQLNRMISHRGESYKLDRKLIHTEGVALIREWIEKMGNKRAIE